MIRCSICTHPSVGAIDALIQSKRSLNSIAKAMGVGADSLQRHVRNGHVPPRPGAPKRIVPVISAADAARIERAEQTWAEWKFAQTGVPVADLLDCWRNHTAPDDDTQCVAGSVMVESDCDVITAFEKVS